MNLDRTTLRTIAALLGALCSAASPAAPQLAARVEISPTDYPYAKCNDDTQASYYLRGAGPDGAISGRKWLLFLHGGGHCDSDAACAERWYDPDAGPDGIIGYHGNMTTSTTATKDFDGEGILDDDGVDGKPEPGTNPFTGFNRIMIPYCSSDRYSGRNTTARPVDYAAYVGTTVVVDGRSVTIENPGQAIPPLTSIRFAGRYIVEAVVDLVMNGGIQSGRRVDASSPSRVDPPSAATDEVVISGSSAGGGGVVRNLDNLAGIVRSAAPAVKVFGIIDASDFVGVLPDSSLGGDGDFEVESFYAAGGAIEADQSCQAVHPVVASGTTPASYKCFNTGVLLKSFIETPHYVVQQAYDGVIHGGLAQRVAAELEALSFPAAPAQALAVQFVRNRITLGALELGGGVADPQHVGWFIPNYDTAKHQLIVEDLWFFNSPLAYLAYGGNDPRLGGDPRSTMGLPRGLACFRFKVTGQGSGCVDPGDARFINTTYPTNPLTAVYDLGSSTLTLPLVRLSNNTWFRNVSVVLDPLGRVVVDDPGVGGLGSPSEYLIDSNVIKLPFVTVDGRTYERVTVSAPGLRVLSYEAVNF
jgi:hypothetical protein